MSLYFAVNYNILITVNINILVMLLVGLKKCDILGCLASFFIFQQNFIQRKRTIHSSSKSRITFPLWLVLFITFNQPRGTAKENYWREFVQNAKCLRLRETTAFHRRESRESQLSLPLQQAKTRLLLSALVRGNCRKVNLGQY